MILQANGRQNKAGKVCVAILISDKIDFKPKKVKKTKIDTLYNKGEYPSRRHE